MIRIELLTSDIESMLQGWQTWHSHNSKMFGCAYFDAIFACYDVTRYKEIPLEHLRFMFSNFKRGADANNDDMPMWVSGRRCVMNGICTFLGKYENAHVRVVFNECHQKKSVGAQIYAFDPMKKRVLGLMSFFIQRGKAHYSYHPHIIEIPVDACPLEKVIAVLTSRDRWNATSRICATLRRSVFDPTYTMCKRRLMREFLEAQGDLMVCVM